MASNRIIMSMMPTNVASAQRSIEKDFSESLHRNLHVLQRFYSPEPEFLSVFHPHMFIKSNPKAFPHVMHFIFTCLNAAEFQKRFLWPIYEKSGESRFRTSTLEYINFLNVKHNLRFEPLKMHFVVIPGGLKFIKIVHRLSVLCMKQELKKQSASLAGETMNANVDLDDFEKFVDDGLKLTSEFDSAAEALTKRTRETRALIESFFGHTKGDQCWRCVTDKWQDDLDRTMENEIAPSLHRLCTFNASFAKLQNLVSDLFDKKRENLIQYDRSKLYAAQNYLLKVRPDLQREVEGLFQKNSINFENLFRIFDAMSPAMWTTLDNFQHQDVDMFQYEYNVVKGVRERTDKLFAAVTKFKRRLQPFVSKYAERARRMIENDDVALSQFRLQGTPVIVRRTNTNPRPATMLRCVSSAAVDPNSTTFTPKPATASASKPNKTVAAADAAPMSPNTLRKYNRAMRILSRVSACTEPRISKPESYSSNSFLNKISTPILSSTMCATEARSINAGGCNLKVPRMETLMASPITPIFPTNNSLCNVLEYSPTNRLSSHRFGQATVQQNMSRTLLAFQNNNGTAATESHGSVQQDGDRVTVRLNEICMNNAESLFDTSDGVLKDTDLLE